ncbi:MAG: CheR family methyltransferase [Pirellulaceae bacterium]|nr:CheR family methyltransferase [Pirellulaceae bacterium]
MDLITCRNLLIYLEPELQKKIFPAFHFALKPGGFLFLGAGESIGGR